MRAGKLDKIIQIQRSASTVDQYGTPSEGWSNVATVRAQLIQATTEEFLRSYGSTSEAAVIFRIRHMTGLNPKDRILHDGITYDLKEVKLLGRMEGMDLRCVAST